MTGWRSRWRVTVASDVSSRDGVGWEFADVDGRDVWFVFREDGGEVPMFSAVRGAGPLPPHDDLEAMTRAAVTDLLASAGLWDAVGWNARNISGALLLASCDVRTWEGVEWALEDGAEDAAHDWASAADPRVPFDWLRAHGVHRDAAVGIYQDDATFGLCFIPRVDLHLPERAEGSWRPRRNIPLVTGPINAVEALYDTDVDGRTSPGLLTEVLLHGGTDSTLLVAAEAYARDEWHLYDESVVALNGLDAADSLAWLPGRRPWRSTIGSSSP